MRPLPRTRTAQARQLSPHVTSSALRSMLCFKPHLLTPLCDGTAGVACSKRACSSVADPTDDGKVRARRRAGAAAPCFPRLGLAQVSLTARPRARSVLLCVPAPCLSSMAQPDHWLHSLGGRWLSDAAFGPFFDGCQADASGYSIAERRSSRRPPRCSTASALEPAHPPTLAPTPPIRPR